MITSQELTHRAHQQYAAAHASHYTSKNLPAALTLYAAVIASYPDSPEAGYSRSQIHNIVSAVVPKQTFLDAQLGLAFAHFGQDHTDHTT